MTQFHQPCSGIGYCRQPGFRHQSHIRICEQFQQCPDVILSGVLVQFMEIYLVNMPLQPIFGQESACSPQLFHHEAFQGACGIQHMCRYDLFHRVISQRRRYQIQFPFVFCHFQF